MSTSCEGIRACGNDGTRGDCCNPGTPNDSKYVQICNSLPPKPSCCDGRPKEKCDGESTSSEEACTELPRSDSLDIEGSAAREHVTIHISGMDCTGCGTKMENTLAQISGISNPDVTFVSGKASFKLDTRIASIEHVMSLVEKRTGFKCSRIIEGYQHMDVHMSAEIAQQIERDCIEGLVSVTRAKSTYRITYNPQFIGARDLLPPGVELAPPAANPSDAGERLRLLRTAWLTCVAAVLTIPVVVLNWSPNSVSRRTRDITSLILATAVQAIAVPEFYAKALKSLVFARIVEMDMLVVISITAAYCYSVVAFGLTEAGVQLEQKAFFETSTLLITLILLGRLIAAFARVKAVRAVSMRSLQAKETLLLGLNCEVTPIDARLLQFGDSIVVGPHSSIVTDGVVTSGSSTVDESMMTGETVPIRKEKGNSVIAGTLNGEGSLHVRITRLPGANSIDDIAKSVETALDVKPKIQDLADRVASWFVPVVVATSILVFVIWIGIALEVRGSTPGGAVGTAITYAIAVLAVSCPCALGLAVPMVLVIAGGAAARAGVVIKAADATERGYKVTDVVFDKTGTLTTGTLSVVREEPLDSKVSANDAFCVVRALVKDDGHPVSRAVASHLGKVPRDELSLSDIRSVAGQGVQACWDRSDVKVGNPFWLGCEDLEAVSTILAQGMTCLCLAIDGYPVFAFGLESEIRSEAFSATSALHSRGITCHIVSGDHAKTVNAIALALHIDPAHTASRHSPTQKQEYVKALQDAGKLVLFCGDGTNDAVALAQANVGVQLGTASDVAGAVADAVLLSGLDGVLTLLDISKRAFSRVLFNFVWAAVYNIFAVLLAAGAFVKIRIPPAKEGIEVKSSLAPVSCFVLRSDWSESSQISRSTSTLFMAREHSTITTYGTDFDILEMPICIECRYPVSALYTTYSKADDKALGKGVRLTQCPNCKIPFADKYVEHDFVVLFIDLVLIKPQVSALSLTSLAFGCGTMASGMFVVFGIRSFQVYRHLLFNRLGRADDRFDPSIIRLGVLLLLFDVYLTWARIEKATPSSPALPLAPPPPFPSSQSNISNTTMADFTPTTANSASLLASQPILIQYLFFLALCAVETASFHMPIRWLLSIKFPRPLSSLIPYYPHKALISTALLVSSFTKLFPLLLLVWNYDLPSSASAVSWAVIINNVAALEILLDCGYVRAALLAAVGAVFRAGVGWCILRAVGVGGGVAAAGVVETGDVIELWRRFVGSVGLV
ncbi:hypothetical protein Q7P37_011202 [Cladosporium fusiforme]